MDRRLNNYFTKAIGGKNNDHMTICSISVITSEVQINTIRNYFTSTRMTTLN
jgi:hypothetical protein